MSDSSLFKIGEIVDKIVKQTGLGNSCSLDKLEELIQELKKYGIYWNLKQVHDCLIRRKQSGSERKNGALGPMVSSNETLTNNSPPSNHTSDTTTSPFKDYTRISSILNNDDNEPGSQRARATITATATAITTATATATATATTAATTTAATTITATAIATIIATATATATAPATAIVTHTAPFDPTAVLPPLDNSNNSLYQNNNPILLTLQPDHVMKEQTYRFPSFM